MAESNGEAKTDSAVDVRSHSTRAARRDRAGWIVFGAVSVLWLPATFALLGNEWYGGPRVDPAGQLKVVALFTLAGLPLALACGLICWAGSPGGAWALLATLGTFVFIWSVGVLVAFSKDGHAPLGRTALAVGLGTAAISLPIWLGYAIWRVARYWERRAADAGSGKHSGLGWEPRNRSGDPGEGA